MLPVLLILLSAALHAGWNFAVRRHPDREAATALLIAGSLIWVVPASLLWPGGSWGLALRWGAVAGLFEASYFVTLSRGLEVGPLATVYTTARGGSMLLVWPASHWLLGEAWGWRSALAVGVLLGGLLLLAPAARSPTSRRTGFFWAGLSACFIAGNHLIYKNALALGCEPLKVFLVALVTALPLVILMLGPRGGRWRRLADAARILPGLLAFGSVAVGVSFLLALVVMQGHGVAWMMSLRNVSIAFAQLLGWALLRERPTWRSGGGVGLVFAGALLLGAS